MNTYTYVSGNPISKFDFFGLAEMCNIGFPISLKIPHTFLCANGRCAGYYPSGNALFSDGELKDDSLRYSIASCSDVPQKNCTKEELDNCISNFVNKIGPIGDKYNFYANNCGQWATKVITYCRSQCDQ